MRCPPTLNSAEETARSATQLTSAADVAEDKFAAVVNSRYISPTKSPLRATVTETRPELAAVPLTVCSIVSILKLVWRRY